MKYVFVTPDGLPDRPQPTLDNRTPLAVAAAPNFDALAQEGRLGLAKVLGEADRLDSSVALMVILGYRGVPITGRGYYEALDAGVSVSDAQWVARSQFVSGDGGSMKSASVSVATTEARQLTRALNEAAIPGLRFHLTNRANQLAVVERSVLPFTRTAPPWDVLGQPLAQALDADSQGLVELMRRAHAVLDVAEVNNVRRDLGEPPANMVYLWGAGEKVQYTPMADKYGIAVTMVSFSSMARGVALAIGAPNAITPDESRQPREELRALAIGVREALNEHDFVVVHVGYPDNYAPSRDPKGKVRAIELIDEYLLGSLRTYALTRQDTRIAVVPTVVADSGSSKHLCDPVPALFWGPGITADMHTVYTEAAAAHAGALAGGEDDLVRALLQA